MTKFCIMLLINQIDHHSLIPFYLKIVFIHQIFVREIVHQLQAQLNVWEEQGLRVDEIQRWSNYTPQQCAIVRQIWNTICTESKTQYKIETLIDRQKNEMDDKLSFGGECVSCLDTYCEDAYDKDFYRTHLEIVQKQLTEKVLNQVEIPSELHILLHFAKLLNPLTASNAWRIFRERQNKSKFTLSCSILSSFI